MEEKQSLIIVGKIYSCYWDGRAHWKKFSSLKISDKRITYLGNEEFPKKEEQQNVTILRIPDNCIVIPGLQDSHIHPIGGSLQQMECDVRGATDLDSALAKILDYYEKHPECEWIIGSGWKDWWFTGENEPRKILDKIIPHKPVQIRREGGHATWVNSQALKLANITKETPEVKGGIIVKDADGNPNGILEEEAGKLIYQILPKHTSDQKHQALKQILLSFVKQGITYIQDAFVRDINYPIWNSLYSNSDISSFPRVGLCLGWSISHSFQKNMEYITSSYGEFPNLKLRARAVKLIVDGVTETKTAFMKEDYIDSEKEADEKYKRGFSNFEKQELKEIISQLDALNFQVHIHAVGDQAVSDSLDCIEEACLKNNSIGKNRHQITHLQVVDPVDIPRFYKLQVIANFQSFWMQNDKEMHKAKQILKEKSFLNQYPIRSIYNTGANIALSSDWPVSTYNPFHIMQVAITHRPISGNEEQVLSEQTLDIETSLWGYTLGAAFANFSDKETGSLDVGKIADLVILNQDVFSLPSEKLHTTKVLVTMIDGKIVWKDPSFQFQ